MTLGPSLPPARGVGDPQIERLYLHARRLCEDTNDPIQLFQVLAALTGVYIAQGRMAQARETAQQLGRLVETMPLPPFEFAATLFMGMVAYHSGDLGKARQLLQRAVALDQIPLPASSHDFHVFALAYLAMTLLQQGLPDYAQLRLQQAARRAAARESPFERGFVAQVSCVVALTVRDMDALATSGEQAMTFDDFPPIAAVGRVSCGRVMCERGDHRNGIAMMREGTEAYRATGQRPAVPTLVAMLAEGYAVAGDITAALACVIEAQTITPSCGEIRYRGELHRLEGSLHAALGDRPAAERCMQRAATLAHDGGERWWELRTATDLARLALQQPTSTATRRNRRAALKRVLGMIDSDTDFLDIRCAHQVLASRPQP